jgi:hypothetical protein
VQTAADEAEIQAVIDRMCAADERAVAAHYGEIIGVHRSGMSGTPGFAPRKRTEVELRAEAEAEVARSNAFRASPRGRFIKSVNQLLELGYSVEWNELLSIYSRSLTDLREPLNHKAVGRALAILAPINHSDARAATAALADLLAADAPAMAEAA